mgnify:CR=1 FL=1
MDLLKRIIADPKVKAVIVLIIGMIAEALVGVVQAVGTEVPVP